HGDRTRRGAAARRPGPRGGPAIPRFATGGPDARSAEVLRLPGRGLWRKLVPVAGQPVDDRAVHPDAPAGRGALARVEKGAGRIAERVDQRGHPSSAVKTEKKLLPRSPDLPPWSRVETEG